MSSASRLRRLKDDVVHDTRGRRRDVVRRIHGDDGGVRPGSHEELSLRWDRVVVQRDDLPLRLGGAAADGSVEDP